MRRSSFVYDKYADGCDIGDQILELLQQGHDVTLKFYDYDQGPWCNRFYDYGSLRG